MKHIDAIAARVDALSKRFDAMCDAEWSLSYKGKTSSYSGAGIPSGGFEEKQRLEKEVIAAREAVNVAAQRGDPKWQVRKFHNAYGQAREKLAQFHKSMK